MSHMVIFQTPDGNPGYNQFEQLDEAVRFVESLRNEQGVENARMFALEEVKFDFKPYFRVEIDPPMVGPGPAANGAAAAPSGPTNHFASAPPPPPPPAQVAPQPDPARSDPMAEAPAARYAEVSSPLGNEPGIGDVPPPTFMTPTPTPAGAEGDVATARRGLFGR